MPPSGAHAVWLTVQSAVQMPLPTPPGLTADRSSLVLMQTRPEPHSVSALHAAPSLAGVGGGMPGGAPDFVAVQVGVCILLQSGGPAAIGDGMSPEAEVSEANAPVTAYYPHRDSPS